MDDVNPLEQSGQNQLDEIALRDFYKKVTVYDEEGTVKLFHIKGRVYEILEVMKEHGGIDTSGWRIVENEELA